MLVLLFKYIIEISLFCYMQIQIILYVSDLKALFKQQKRSAFFMQNNFRTIKNKTKNFTIIDNTILRDKNLSLKARGLLCFMLHLPETWVFTEKGLATVTGEGLKSIKSGLKELEDNKYLYRVQMRDSGGSFGSMMYYLFEQPTEMKVDGNQRVDSLFIQQLINIYLKKINKYYVPVKIQVNGASSLYEKALASLLENQKEVTLINEEWFLPQPKLVFWVQDM